MIDIAFLLRRKAEMSPEEFHRYWREQHAPLVTRHAPALGIRRYSQLHNANTPLTEVLRSSRGCDPNVYDGIALVSFDSLDAVAAAAATSEGQAAGVALLEDERRFLDLERCVISFADRHDILSA